MPSSAVGRALLIFLSYAAIAAAFAWPLPMQMSTALPGQPSGDTGVYVWNIWVFRHEVVAHARFPFFTSEILSLAAPVPLTLHNYTALAGVLAYFVLPIAGVVATFNGLLILSSAASAYAMFLLARKATGDGIASWLAGAAFGFSPFLMARMTAHFSLLQAWPLPLFVLLVLKAADGGSWRVAAAAGAVVAFAYLCDPYYAVYCVVALILMAGYASVTVAASERRRYGLGRRALDAVIVALAAVISAIMIDGGGRVVLFGIPISMRSLYTPVLVLTALAVARWLLAARRRMEFGPPAVALDWRLWAAAGVAGAVALSPVLVTLAGAISDAGSLAAPVLWRSSARGVDLLALIAPNPLHPWLSGLSASWIATLPEGFVENVASVPLTVLGVIAAAAFVYRTTLPRGWRLWTVFFAVLSLGPFIHVAGINTFVPTPWTLLRYVPLISAARMPTRFSVLVAMGAAVLFAAALAGIRRCSRRPALATGIAAALLLFELLPAPRALYSAVVPPVFYTVAADPRPLRVIDLPFGLRDGLSSDGNFSALSQFHQTVHEKPLIGGYVSRLPRARLAPYAESGTLQLLMRLSAGGTATAAETERVLSEEPAAASSLQVGWVVMDRQRTSPALAAFAIEAFDLRFVESSAGYDLYVPGQR